jgi:hypothetical protein
LKTMTLGDLRSISDFVGDLGIGKETNSSWKARAKKITPRVIHLGRKHPSDKRGILPERIPCSTEEGTNSNLRDSSMNIARLITRARDCLNCQISRLGSDSIVFICEAFYETEAAYIFKGVASEIVFIVPKSDSSSSCRLIDLRSTVEVIGLDLINESCILAKTFTLISNP